MQLDHFHMRPELYHQKTVPMLLEAIANLGCYARADHVLHFRKYKEHFFNLKQ
jgi:hypothetical protein